MRCDVCILSNEKAFAAMLELELEDSGMRVAICQTEAAAAVTEAGTYLVDADAFSFQPPRGRLVRYGRGLEDAPPPGELLHRPFLFSALRAAVGDSAARSLLLPPNEQAVLLDGERIALTAREYACLACLWRAAGAPVSREQLLCEVWGGEETDPGVVSVYLHYLRKKLERGGKKRIYAIRGRGYALRREEDV